MVTTIIMTPYCALLLKPRCFIPHQWAKRREHNWDKCVIGACRKKSLT